MDAPVDAEALYVFSNDWGTLGFSLGARYVFTQTRDEVSQAYDPASMNLVPGGSVRASVEGVVPTV